MHREERRKDDNKDPRGAHGLREKYTECKFVKRKKSKAVPIVN